MLERLTCTCEAPECETELGRDHWALTMETEAGVRHVYECDCGAVTVTVGRR